MKSINMKIWILTLCLGIGLAGLQAQTKIACIGNSITYGYGLLSPSEQSYPTLLQEMLGDNYLVKNYGVSARTLLKNGNLPYWNEPQYAEAKAFNPDTVIIMLGTNDAKLKLNWQPHHDEFIMDYEALVRTFKSLPSKPEIWICEVVPAYRRIWDISDSTIVYGVNPAIMKVAKEEHVHLVNMYNKMSGHPEWFQDDGIHPNKEGAEAMAGIFYEVLTEKR
ncbi:MAG TPA: GDSL-type esterase/lipase family protein [Bacteroidales bacterium]|nr:GDSL-type esterase/lipase family protein [Bacteroidales bacterium]